MPAEPRLLDIALLGFALTGSGKLPRRLRETTIRGAGAAYERLVT
jgi:hypothetical protein